MARGKTNRSVATALFLSEKTIESHLGRIYQKLGVHSRVALTALITGDRGARWRTGIGLAKLCARSVIADLEHASGAKTARPARGAGHGARHEPASQRSTASADS